jgi:non-specific serine/threonine protein kinase
VLTKRQAEIAELVADGLTSKEIAERLTISLRTAESHVEAIRTRLGFHTRAEIAAWVATHNR